MRSLLRSLFTTECLVDGKEFECAPTLAVDVQRTVVSIGNPVAASAVKVYEPFVSTAALDADSLAAKLILQYAYSKLGRWSWLRFSPRVLLHSPQEGPGAIAGVSDAKLEQLSQAAGALRTIVHRGRALSTEEALSRLRA